MEYNEIIEEKQAQSLDDGFMIYESEINPYLYDFQKLIVKWAVKKGRAAIFADTGLGKTLMQIEWARAISEKTGGKILFVSPLAVTGQTIQEGIKIDVEIEYSRGEMPSGNFIITNYEMVRYFNAEDFAGIVLDESSILKNYTGKTKQYLDEKFRETKYKLCCTATPSPNDHLELGNHAQFLGVMKSNEMISRYFINDTMAAGKYRLKKHAAGKFWKWVSTWAIAIMKPSDIGFSDDGYILPLLEEKIHIIDVSHLPPTPGQLFRTVEISATDIHREMRLTAPVKAKELRKIMGDKINEPWVIWCNTDYEAVAIRKEFPEITEVKGKETPEAKIQKFNDFVTGEFNVLLTKPKIAAHGMNWQHCHNVIVMGLSYSYELYYQLIRRFYRYGQKEAVNVHILCAETEKPILDTIHRKGEDHRALQQNMCGNILEHFEKKMEIKLKTEITKGEDWEMILNDAYCHMKEMQEGTVDFSIYSPPFSNLYIYSDSLYDLGNSRDHSEFFKQYQFIIQENYRITRPGRLVAIHCKDLPLYKGRDGAAGLYDFPGEIIRAHEKVGFTFHSRVTIWKAPEIEMQRTKNHGLLYKQLKSNSAASRQGMADYMIIFRKNVPVPDKELENPVCREGKTRFQGNYIGEDIPCDRGSTNYDSIGTDIETWRKYASPVWFDIQQTKVLNARIARDENDEKHICPLQLDVIARCIELWSNPGDLVFSPFAGVGSEGYVAVEMERRFIGVELKETYYRQAIEFLKEAEQKKRQHTLFANIAN